MAIALNILDLMVVERVNDSHKVADDVCSEVAGPLNDIARRGALMDDFIGNERPAVPLRRSGQRRRIRQSLQQAVEGPNTKVLGVAAVKGADDPVIGGAHILVADDEPNIRNTIHDVLRKYHAIVTMAVNGARRSRSSSGTSTTWSSATSRCRTRAGTTCSPPPTPRRRTCR